MLEVKREAAASTGTCSCLLVMRDPDYPACTFFERTHCFSLSCFGESEFLNSHCKSLCDSELNNQIIFLSHALLLLFYSKIKSSTQLPCLFICEYSKISLFSLILSFPQASSSIFSFASACISISSLNFTTSAYLSLLRSTVTCRNTSLMRAEQEHYFTNTILQISHIKPNSQTYVINTAHAAVSSPISSETQRYPIRTFVCCERWCLRRKGDQTRFPKLFRHSALKR